MIGYYLDLARRSLRRNVALTILMILAIAFGVGASMTTLTVLHVLSADPIPGKSDQLYYVQLDPRPVDGYKEGEEPLYQSTRQDAETLVRAKQAERQVLMTGGGAAIESQQVGVDPFNVEARWASADFFPMFDVPFVAGGPWTAEDDDAKARVVVLAKPLAEKVFGTTDVVGRTIRVESNEMRVVGVTDTWFPTPHFFDLNTGAYGVKELLYAPFSTSRELKFGRNGSMNCWNSHQDPEALGAPCEWIQLWVELSTEAKRADYYEYLTAYSRAEKEAGRYHRPPNVRLRNVMEWLEHNQVVPNDARLQMWISLGFLLVCLINTVGLLLTKFMRRSPEIGVRRALGASKKSIFTQLLVEAGMIGIVGGVLGLLLAWLGLWAVRHQPTPYAALAELDTQMLLATFGLAVITSLLAGVLPAWRGCQVTPALQLKSH